MGNNDKYKGLFWIVSSLLLIVLIAYNLYSGLTVRKIGIPGIFELEFGKVGSDEDKVRLPPKVLPDKIARRIEELQRELEINENDQMRASLEIERLRPMLETDRDARQAIEHQERWLEELRTARQQIEHELNRLREQR